jgi:hypothetical protein
MNAPSWISGPSRTFRILALFVAALAITVAGCEQATEPDLDSSDDGVGEFDGQIDPGSNTVLLKQIEATTIEGVPIRIELVGRFVRPATGPDTVAMAVAVRNADQMPLYPPAEIVLSSFQPPSVAPAAGNADWTTCPGESLSTIIPIPDPSQCLYGYSFQSLLGDDNVLTPGELSGERLMVFADPGSVSFAFRVQARFGLSPSRPRIEGLFYSDNNRNGQYDEGEPPFGGGWVHATGPGLADRIVSVNSDGRYVIPVREAGLYSLWAMPPPTFAPVEPTTSNPLEVVLLRGSDGQVQSFLDANFGWTNSPLLPPVRFVDSTDSLELDQYAVAAIQLGAQSLSMRVGFSGCGPDHPFQLYMVGGLMESYPPQARLVLSHDDLGELCDAYFERDLGFDLWPILHLTMGPDGSMSSVIIHFEAWDGQTYTYEVSPYHVSLSTGN